MTDLQPTRIEPTLEQPHPAGSGTQRLFRFDNGLGASVIQFEIMPGVGSYGAAQGLWELAVLRFAGDGLQDFELSYDTGITDDVMGHLTEDEVQETLAKIRDLPGDVIRVEATLGAPLAITTGEESTL